MSGWWGVGSEGQGQASANVHGSGLPSQLMELLTADDIQPGTPLGYAVAKTIYSFHPLGAKLADAPITMAQSQSRDIEIPVLPEGRLVDAFRRTWGTLGKVGADVLIHNVMKTSRIYGIGSLAVGARDFPTDEPLPLEKIHELDLYFNVLDPLNTAGSLVLDQDPNAPDYQKPRYIIVGQNRYHPSRTCIVLNEQPVYIEWTTSAFGYVGRSVYQRALYPLKTFVQSMITDQMITQKAGLLVAKMKSPGSVISNTMQQMFGWKRGQLKAGTTGQVVSIGIDESVETLNMQNLEGAARFARDNMLKNIATAANMPASMVNNETLAEGFGEGSEDAKQIARYIDRVRIEMYPVYSFMDSLVQRIAWSPSFYETIQRDYPEYRKIPYETAFYEWQNAFIATWPNLLVEPDSEKVAVEKVRFESVVAVAEILDPILDPVNKAKMAMWVAENVNDRPELFASPLELDEDLIANYVPPEAVPGPREPLAFESET